MAKNNKKLDGPSFAQEAIAVAGLFAAVFLFLCLVSYSLPILSAASYTSAANWCGTVGHFIAWGLMSLLGISSFWFIILLVFFSVQFFSSTSDFERLPLIFLGSFGILIASSSLLGITYPAQGDYIDIFGRYYPAGGMTGSLLAHYLRTYLGTPGAILLLLLLLVFSFMLAVRFSPYFVGRKLLRAAYGRISESYFQKGEAKPQKEKTVQDVFQEPRIMTAVPSVNEPVTADESEYEGDEDGDFQVKPVTTGEYRLPGIALLDKVESSESEVDLEHYYAVSKKLEDKLRDFGISGKVEGISPGPVVTTYEFAPAPGIKITRIMSLADDLAMGLKAESVRIVGSIPGKAALGIEIPNPQRAIVYIRDILASETFKNSTSKLTLGLGKDVVGQPVIADLAKMPHLLIAGATGSGKSVGINSIICSILFKATPDEVRFLLIDPKRIELSGYEDIPHLLHPVVFDPKMANRALQWAVREMERRYMLLDEMRVKSFASYNQVAEKKLPLIVIVVDELADLMMISSREVEESIARLAQMARAAGMHLILATQRPSVDVLTGLIKANFPTRLSFKVFSKVDSRTILDMSGAEHLLGDGDSLFMPPGKARMQRIHGAYISEKETERVIEFLKEQGTASYDESVIEAVEEENGDYKDIGEDEYDEKYDEAVALVCETGQASISMVQRRLRVGYNRAARMIEIMEKEGIVGPSDGSKPREVLARKNY
jgi:S-DNA-T family DNA segregation ATPase FtsK/SpoIIIE